MGAGAQQTAGPPKAGTTPPKPEKGSTEREYVVLKESSVDGAKTQLEVVGRFTAATAKHARVEAAKSGKAGEKPALEKGVELRAIPASAWDAGHGTIKLEVKEAFVS